jgi:hypothetical protein
LISHIILDVGRSRTHLRQWLSTNRRLEPIFPEPGVTRTEQVIYALLDLSRRLEFSVILEILVDDFDSTLSELIAPVVKLLVSLRTTR